MTSDEFEDFICADYDQAIDALGVPEWPEEEDEPEKPELSLNCQVALALYGHYVSLGIEQKAEEQHKHIEETFGLDADDYLSDPEIGKLEDALFDME